MFDPLFPNPRGSNRARRLFTLRWTASRRRAGSGFLLAYIVRAMVWMVISTLSSTRSISVLGFFRPHCR